MHRILMTLLVPALLAFSMLPAQAASREEQRAEIQRMRTEVLTQLYKAQPGSEKEVRDAYGTAVFSNAGVTAFFLTAAYGSGIARDNKTGKETYMQMASGGVGLGLGIKDFRAVFIFRDASAFNHFVDQGYDFSGQADAAAQAGAKGGSFSGAADVIPGVRVYQLTQTGLALQATLQGTKYWKDAALNDAGQPAPNAGKASGGFNN